MISSREIVNWSCTKLADVLYSKNPNWLADNLTMDGAIAIEMKLKKCSRETYIKARPIINLIKAKVATRK